MSPAFTWLTQHLLTCSFQKQFGVHCPGCGFQRAFVELLQGHAMASVEQFPALIPWLATVTLTALHLVFRFERGATYITYLFLLTAGLMAFNLLSQFS
jgi:hypothetical protein